ncbi:hypothetical protein V6N13_088513 [Hibiscus sabdariffa]|uniref:50S ribosomal protein L14, chloroplastic n=2 Tax=Malvaceae TaxID=3629 RepID=A0ABR2FZZ6_9ROSI
MIQPQTHLNVADNSGARELMCIRVIGASNRRYAHIGDVIVAVIKEAVPNTPLERSEVIRAVIVRTCKELKRDNGMIIGYDDNAAVVIDQEGNPKGTRIFGAIARELRQLNFTKIVSLAPESSAYTTGRKEGRGTQKDRLATGRKVGIDFEVGVLFPYLDDGKSGLPRLLQCLACKEETSSYKGSLFVKVISILSACSSTVIILQGKQGALVALGSLLAGYCMMRLQGIEQHTFCEDA